MLVEVVGKGLGEGGSIDAVGGAEEVMSSCFASSSRRRISI